MSNIFGTPSPQQWGTARQEGRLVMDQGLRSYMLGVYNYMMLGLVVTGLAAYAAYAMSFDPAAPGPHHLTSFGVALYASPLKYLIMFAPMGFVLALSFGINRFSAGTAKILFFVFAAVMGLSISSILLVYAHSTIFQAFFVAAAAFGGLSVYGYMTQRDLSPMGSFLTMGLFGLVIASVVGLFFHSSAFQTTLAILTVLIFAGLTAWDTQNIKNNYYAGDGYEVAAKKSIYGALMLYLDFINIFLALVQLMGGGGQSQED